MVVKNNQNMEKGMVVGPGTIYKVVSDIGHVKQQDMYILSFIGKVASLRRIYALGPYCC